MAIPRRARTWPAPAATTCCRPGTTLHAGHAADQLLRQVVLALRTWRPDVIVTDAPDAGGADGLVAEVVKQAFKDAADPQIFPEQISALGLEPWKAAKLYGRCDGKADGPVSIDLTAVSAPLEATLREFAENAAAVLGDEAPVIPAKRSFRLIAATLPGAADHRDLMQGVELAQRRPRPAAGGGERAGARGGQGDPPADGAAGHRRDARSRG